MSKLTVELYGTKLGTLSQRDNRVEFETFPEVFDKYSLSSVIMSLAVPLNLQYTSAQKKRTDVFFAELLPEGRNYEWLSQTLPYGDRNTFGMLRKYGKDIAGALIIYDPDDPASAKTPEAEPVNSGQVRYLMENMPQASLANSPEKGKTSLGGIQGKIVLAKKGKTWHRIHSGYPSTHILKPVAQEYPTLIYDEAFCMQMAFNSGLTNHHVHIENFDGADALVIERYDRENGINAGRIHQEDFSQVLGARGAEKYQEYGGKVSAKRIAQVLNRFGSDEDVRKFASQLIFAAATGNLDMHAKNVSILHLPDETVRLAPAYDHVPLRHQNTDGRMALAIDGEYFHANISLKNITAELVSWQSRCFTSGSEAADFIISRLHLYNNALETTKPGEKAYPNLKSDISSFISNLLKGKSTGRVKGWIK